MELTKILSSGIDANSVTPAILTKIQSSFDADSSTLTVPNFSVTTVTAGNVKTNNLLYANGSAYVFSGSNAAGSNTQIQFNNANSFAASGNLTFDTATNTLATTNLNATGNVALNGANVSLGAVGNLRITGGTSGHVLQTDGSGSLSWVSPAGSGSVFSISKGTSNVNVPIENGNITIGIGGTSNVVVVTTTGIVVNGNIDAGPNYVIGNGYYLTDVDAGTANIANSIILGNTSIKAIQNGNVFIDVAGTPNTVVFTSTGVNIAGYANITGNVNAPYFIGNGAFLTGVDTSPANISNGTSNVQVISSGGNVTTSIGGTANVVVVSSANVDVTGNITASSNVTAKNELIVGNAATASDNWGRIRLVSSSNTYGYTVGSPALVISHEEDGTNQAIVLGDASALSSDTLFGISVLSGGNTSPTIGNEVGWTSRLNLAGNGNLVIAGKLTSVDADLGNAVSANYFIGNVANITGNVTAGNINAGNISTSGSGGNITGANVVSANTFIGSGNNLSNIQGANVTGAVSSATSATTAGTVTTAAQPNITSVGTLTGFTSNGVVNFTNASNVTLGAVGNVRVTGGSTGQYLQTDGSGTLTWATINTGIPSNIANGNSNVNIPSANGNVNISAVGNANVVVVTGTGANINGYATISGTVTAGNISTSGSGGNITGANVISANIFTGSGNNLSNIQGANVSGAVGLATYATTANAVAGANVSGAVGLATYATTANAVAGANVSGAVSFATTANAVAGANVSGEVASAATANSVAGANISGQVANALIAGTVYTNAQPNITSVGTLTGITSTGTANFTGASNVALGPVANVHITGGSTGQYLQTDGSGTLNWASISTSSTLANVNSSVNIPTANGNVNLTAAGNTSLVVTGTGANVTGTLNVTGDATVGNLTGANVVSANTFTASANITASNANLGNTVTANYFTGNLYGTANLAVYATTANSVAGANVSGQVGNSLIAGTVYTGAQPNITSVGTLTDLNVSGNAVVTGNLVVNGALEYTNVNNLYIKDPIIELGGGVNVAPLTTNDGKDRGTLLHYHTSAPVDAFMGWDNSNAEFAFGSNVSVTSEVVTFNSLGNVRASYFIGNGSQLTGITATSGNANYANFSGNAFSVTGSNVSGQVGNALVAGTVYTNAQPNITSIGTLTSLNVSGTVTAVAFTANTGVFTGNGNGLSSIVGANVTGQVSFAATANAVAGANVSGQVGNALVAGTVYTNAQPNITSVGTLSNVSVSGNVNASIIVDGGTGIYLSAGPSGYINFFTTGGDKASISDTGNIIASNLIANSTIFATTANISGNVNAGNANLGNAAVANFFVGSGAFLTSVTAVTAGTVTTNAQPNITSVGLLTSLVVGNATANSTFGNGNITASGNISFTGANVSLGDASNLKITGGSSGYFLTTDGAGNLSWGAASGGGGVSATGSNTQLQFNDGGVLGASANLTFDKSTNTFATARVTASNGANLGSNVANVYIGGGSNNQILKTDGSGNLSWIAQPATTITVDNFTGDGTTVTFTLTASPTSINQTAVNYNGTLQLRAAYTVSGSTLTFTEAPVNGSLIEVTTTLGVMSGAGAFVTRSYTGNGVQATFAVTSGCTVSSVIVTENGLVQVPTVDYTISGSTLTFNGAPANGIIINIRELAIATATSSPGITWNIASSNATMVVSNGYFVDTSGGPKTMTLPASAILGDTIRINDLAGSFATNNLTIARNGHKIQGIADDLLIDADQSSFGLVYSNSTYGWKVLEL